MPHDHAPRPAGTFRAPSRPHIAHTPVWREVVHNPYWILLEDPSLHVICARRTATPITDLAVIGDLESRMAARLGTIHRDHWRLLVDVREAPMRNDPAFEERMRPVQMHLLAGFARTATLVRTQVGKLQVMRTRRESGGDQANSVFLSEEEALAYLLG
jgi:hypothetical protein